MSVDMPEGKRLAKDSFMKTYLQKMLNGIFEESQDLSEIQKILAREKIFLRIGG